MSDVELELTNIGLMIIFGAFFSCLPFTACRLTFTKTDMFNTVSGALLLVAGIACALARWLV